jgi:hypothetical protein
MTDTKPKKSKEEIEAMRLEVTEFDMEEQQRLAAERQEAIAPVVDLLASPEMLDVRNKVEALGTRFDTDPQYGIGLAALRAGITNLMAS